MKDSRMAIIQLRSQFNYQCFKGLVNIPHVRNTVTEKFSEKIDFKLLNYYFIPAIGSAGFTFEGDPENTLYKRLFLLRAFLFLPAASKI